MLNGEMKTRFIKARRKLIEQNFAHLNPIQREAVLTTQGALLLLAGAGSGKTTVLINRIANILRYGRGSDSDFVPEHFSEKELAILENAIKSKNQDELMEARGLCALSPCKPYKIIAITFTNKAAKELKTRLVKMLGNEANDIWAQTFHSACVRMLRRYAEELGYSNSFTIYDTSDSQAIMKHILKDLELDEKMFPYRTVLTYISRAKDSLQNAQSFLNEAKMRGDTRRTKIAQAYTLYEKRLKDANAMDFDDIIYNTVLLLENVPKAREYYQNLFDYVLIDEYQDTNNLQYRLAAALAGEKGNICVVGDDDQSIYKFRGATIENILSFEQQYKNARLIKLEQNYRSTGNILGAANAVISNNEKRKGKQLWTEQNNGEPISLYVAQNESDEASYVANKILENMANNIPLSEQAILYRMNAQSNKLEYALKRNAIPYKIVGGNRFFDRMEVKDIMSYLAILMFPHDNLRLMRIINTPVRGIGQKTIETALDLANEQGIPLYEVIKHAEQYVALTKSATKLRLFVIMIEELKAMVDKIPLDELYDLIIEKTGYVKALELKANDESLARIENIGELKSNIINYVKEDSTASLSGFLDEVALYTDLDNLDEEGEVITLMTMHSAKGLEFDQVFIVGMEEGIFPSARCIGERDEMEEERRLCYVGLTRSRKKLYLTCARQRMLFGKTSSNQPSRFTEEIPEMYMEKTEARPNYDFGGYERSFKESGSSSFGTGSSYNEAPKAYEFSFSKKEKSSYVASKKATPKASFAIGDKINHKAFGEGDIVNMTPMGGDFLVEIKFSDKSRRLMLKAAERVMTKI